MRKGIRRERIIAELDTLISDHRKTAAAYAKMAKVDPSVIPEYYSVEAEIRDMLIRRRRLVLLRGVL